MVMFFVTRKRIQLCTPLTIGVFVVRISREIFALIGGPIWYAITHRFIFFFFQAEDGIRDHCVTGVQTCALPIDRKSTRLNSSQAEDGIRDHCVTGVQTCALPIDRKSTRLNSSHTVISYAVFCLRSEERRVGRE